MESADNIEAKSVSLSHSICGILGLDTREQQEDTAKHDETTQEQETEESKCPYRACMHYENANSSFFNTFTSLNVLSQN